MRARYFIMARANSGCAANSRLSSSRSMGTSSQGVMATAEDTRGSSSKKEASPKRLPAWYRFSTRSPPSGD